MSQKDDPTTRAVLGAFGLAAKSGFAAIAGASAYVADKRKVPPEVQLRQLGTRPIWGEKIVGAACTACGVLNEEDSDICFHCGVEIIDTTSVENNTGSLSEQLPAAIKSKVEDSIKQLREQYGSDS